MVQGIKPIYKVRRLQVVAYLSLLLNIVTIVFAIVLLVKGV